VFLAARRPRLFLPDADRVEPIAPEHASHRNAQSVPGLDVLGLGRSSGVGVHEQRRAATDTRAAISRERKEVMP